MKRRRPLSVSLLLIVGAATVLTVPASLLYWHERADLALNYAGAVIGVLVAIVILND